MTAKEKAKELVDKFCIEINIDSLISELSKHNAKPRAKECALIAVDEIILVMIEEYSEILKAKPTISYWQEVKKEIKKI